MSLKDKILFPGRFILRQLEKRGWYRQNIIPDDLFNKLSEEDKKKVIEECKRQNIIDYSFLFYLFVVVLILIGVIIVGRKAI
jgi:hypothetical protein